MLLLCQIGLIKQVAGWSFCRVAPGHAVQAMFAGRPLAQLLILLACYPQSMRKWQMRCLRHDN